MTVARIRKNDGISVILGSRNWFIVQSVTLTSALELLRAGQISKLRRRRYRFSPGIYIWVAGLATEGGAR